MAGRIPRVFINDLLARTDIVDLIDARVKLKSRVRTITRAVLSITKNPSFTVSGEKQFYYCFGCGAKGNAIDFLMNHDRLDFVESVYAARLPYEAGNGPSPMERHQRQSLYQLLEGLDSFYQQSLRNPQAKSANSISPHAG